MGRETEARHPHPQKNRVCFATGSGGGAVLQDEKADGGFAWHPNDEVTDGNEKTTDANAVRCERPPSGSHRRKQSRGPICMYVYVYLYICIYINMHI